MPPEIKILQGDLLKIQHKELELQSKRYRLVNKTNFKDLLPFEYIKTQFTGSSDSPDEGPGGYTLTWLE